MKYEMVKLGDVCTVLGGTTPNTNKSEYWNGNNIWLSPVDLPEVGSISSVKNSQRKITDLAVKETSLKLLPVGSLVFSSRASIGKIGIVEKPLYTNQGFTNFIPNEQLDVKFLAYALKVNLPKIEKLGNTTTFKEVSRTALKELDIPLPPSVSSAKLLIYWTKRMLCGAKTVNCCRLMPHWHKLFLWICLGIL
jgi:type I restriction enzyme, S subunit